jgi:hypothetical protein
MNHQRSTMSILAIAGLLLAGCGGTDLAATRVADAAAGHAPPTGTPTGDAAGGSIAEDDPIATTPSVAITATPDALKGVNVEVTTTGFRWAPEHASSDPLDGEGHAHLYVDDVKVARLYTPWFHLSGLAPGEHTVRVTLNANDHADLTADGAPVAATTTVTVPESGAAMGHHGDHQIAAPMAVDIDATPDARAGVNLRVTTSGFRWAPERASGAHVDGEGHAHVYVDGEKVGRLYGEWLHLSLDPGEHQIRVTLNGNDHGDYLDGDEVVAATTTVMVHETHNDHNG